MGDIPNRPSGIGGHAVEAVKVSDGTWRDLMTFVSLSVETHRAEGTRWFGAQPPQYQVFYSRGEPVALRIMGTMLMIERGER